jgi:hypothetical protein|tara:strand:+ start:18927 stop:19136 length:210 start_codon:yes stop_codon:yes gene_type:complete
MEQQITLNNTLEEELRIMLVEKQVECNALRSQLDALKKMVAEEQEGKYRAYIKFADLQKEMSSLKQKIK